MTTVDKLKAQLPQFHFSIDDVFESLIEVTDQKIPLFRHPYFSLLKKMHDKYGINVGLHLFFQKEINGKLRNLTEVRDLKKEIIDDGGWIYFGPHALNFDNPPYKQLKEDQIIVFNLIYNEIDRFAGKDFYARWIRLHFYSESYELAEYFAKRGVTALFSTDRPIGSHRMPQLTKDNLNNLGFSSYQSMNFIRTHFRIEFFANDNLSEIAIKNLLKEALVKYGYIILYTHEYEFSRKEVCESLEMTFKILDELFIKSLQKV